MGNSVDFDADLFSDEALENPFPLYAEMRERGPVVRLADYGVWAMSRYAETREALADWKTFSSSRGVGMNVTANKATAGLIIATDPPEHDILRSVLASRLAPRALRHLQGTIHEQARELVEPLVEQGSFDAVGDLARVFPVRVVLGLVGLPADAEPRALAWAEAAFNAGGPPVPRTLEAIPLLEDQFAYLASLHREDLAPGSFGRAIFDAAAEGLISEQACVPLLSAYVTAGMDTTINAISSGIKYFAEQPDTWQTLRADRSLLGSAFNEIIRMESPLQWFGRWTTREVVVGNVTIPSDERVLMFYGSANRDERKWADPDTFDVRRNPLDHLAFGYGTHACAGQGLARIEATAIFSALLERVAGFEVGKATRRLNNRIRGLDTLPTVLTAA